MLNFEDINRFIPKLEQMNIEEIKLAVVTYQDKGTYAAGAVPDENKMLDQLLIELGIDSTFEVWSDESVEWSRYTHILIKSPWDYFDYFPVFLSWCHKIKNLNIPVFNTIDCILWNADKHYLLDIQSKGFPIVPTAFITAGTPLDINLYFEIFGSEELVVKPAISGGSKNTLKVNRKEAQFKVSSLQDVMHHEDFMIQPFIPEVAVTGEFSYIFFDCTFSHAVLKSPKKGEFRVQHFFGGSVHAVQPSGDQLIYLQRLVNEFASGSLYVRVDGIWREGVFYLMELEMIEPYLFLYTDLEAIANYKKAISKMLLRH
jgi:glutathione synthase/RimK-type ligase-like ATP-grasp enzyme